MEILRFATPEEVAEIKLQSDLDPRVPGMVVALDNEQTGRADMAVVKTVPEMDPVFFQPDSTDRRKRLFIWALTNHLRLSSVPVVYFNIDAKDETWQKVAEHFGAECVSPQPVLRYKLQLSKLPEVPDEHH